MRAHVLLILLLIISLNTPAQTPFDSFASEAYCPMLGLRELKCIENGTQQAMPQDTAVIHDDDVSKWLSVDPMADKYPDISPYAYCNWNPVKFVDPDGRDVWELDDCGSIVNIITDDSQDAFRMKGKQISFKYGSVTDTFQDKDQTTFTFENDDVAADAFKFMADNSGVEYALVSGTQTSSIVTQHKEGELYIKGTIASIIGSNEAIKSVIHNHPKNFGPSGFVDGNGDGPTLQTIEKQLGYQIAAYIYLPKTSRLWMYKAQDRNVGISDWSINYPMVGTQSNQTPSWMFRLKNFFGFKIKQ